MPEAWIGLSPSVPTDIAFASTGGKGTPIVIDVSTDTAYYAKPGIGVTALAGSGSGSELPVGSYYFSDNSTNPASTLGYGTWSLILQGYLTLT